MKCLLLLGPKFCVLSFVVLRYMLINGKVLFFFATILTYSMVQSPSWEANWFAASQEIPRNSRNPKIHYRTHKRPPPVSIPGQPNPVHIPTSHLLEIHPNIIHPSIPRSPQYTYCTARWNIAVFDCMCNTQTILCYWTNTTGMTHLKENLPHVCNVVT